MLHHYLLISTRILRRQSFYALVNITSLVIGFTCFLIIMLYAGNELTVDHFHKNRNRIFRILRGYNSGQGFGASTPYVLGSVLEDKYPEINRIVRVSSGQEPSPVRVGEVEIPVRNYIMADPGFFDVFTFETSGLPVNQLLHSPEQVVISDKLARACFGDRNPLGQVIRFNYAHTDFDLQVSGIINHVPENSLFATDLILPMALFEKCWREKPLNLFGTTIDFLSNWGANTVGTYVLLRNGASAEQLEEKLVSFATTQLGENTNTSFHLQSLNDIHLHSSHIKGHEAYQGNLFQLYVLITIAVLILFIASVNYVILATARSSTRIKEVGIRKLLGATVRQIIQQALLESTALSLAALPLAFICMELVLPVFNQAVARNLHFNLFDNSIFLIFSLGVVLFIGLLSGSYIAFFVSRFQPAEVFQKKQQFQANVSRSFLRKMLIVIQITVFIFLTFCSLVIFKQLHFLQDKDLGYNPQHLLCIDVYDDQIMKHFQALKEALQSFPEIVSVSTSTMHSGDSKISLPGHMNDKVEVSVMSFGPDYLKTMQIDLTEPALSSDEPMSVDRVLLNDAAAAALGVNGGISGREIIINEEQRKYIHGVTHNVHVNSLYSTVQPMIMLYEPDHFLNIYIRLNPADEMAARRRIDEVWQSVYPDLSISSHIVADDIRKHYTGERDLGKYMAYATLISMALSGLGLFGLASLMTGRRSREVGIRKVFGATATGIFHLLSREYFVLMIPALLIALPLAMSVIQKWLEHFAYHAQAGTDVFLFTVLLAVGIVFLSIVLQTARTTLVSPMEILKYE